MSVILTRRPVKINEIYKAGAGESWPGEGPTVARRLSERANGLEGVTAAVLIAQPYDAPFTLTSCVKGIKAESSCMRLGSGSRTDQVQHAWPDFAYRVTLDYWARAEMLRAPIRDPSWRSPFMMRR